VLPFTSSPSKSIKSLPPLVNPSGRGILKNQTFTNANHHDLFTEKKLEIYDNEKLSSEE